MPIARIPLVGNPNQRGLDGAQGFITHYNLLTEGGDTLITEASDVIQGVVDTGNTDQIFRNCVPVIYKNPVTGTGRIYLQKRFGTTAAASAGSVEITANFYSNAQSAIYECSGTTVYKDGSSIGTITASRAVYYINSTQISGKEYVCFVSYDSSGNNSEGWYHAQDADGATFTADTDSSNAVLTNVSSTAGLYVGQAISGTGIGTGARIQSIDSGTQITLTVQSTATNTTVTITPTALAKIISANFPTNAQGGFAFIDGYSFIHTATGDVFNSDINTIGTWQASSKIPANKSPDIGKGVYSIGSYIVAFGKDSTEFFQNSGNPFGSVLKRVKEMSKNVGIKSVTDTITGTPVHSFAYGAVIDDGLYFAGQGREGVGCYRLSAGNMEKISPPQIDNIMFKETPKVCGIFCGGQVGVVFSVDLASTGYPADGLVYWPESKIWTYWTIPEDSAGEDTGFWGRAITNPSTYVNYLGSTTGKRFTTDTNTFTDDGNAFSMIVQTLREDLGTQKRKSVKTIGIVCDKQSSGTVTVEYTDDDYSTWTTLGTLDLTSMKPIIHRCGSFVGGRAWRLTHSTNTDFRAESVEIEYEVASY